MEINNFLGFLDSIENCDRALIKAFRQAFLESVYETKPTDYGAGIMFLCPKTQHIFLALRNPSEEDGNVWCGLGGKGEVGENPMETAVREVSEEGGIRAESYALSRQPLYIHQNSPDFKFITFLGLVDNEFIPTLNHEHSEHKWVDLNEINELPLHYGIKDMLGNEKNLEIINYYLGRNHETTGIRK